MAGETTARLAVLIDADNAQPAIAAELMAEVARFGTAHAKRACGNWDGSRLAGWKPHLLAQSIRPVQQYAYTAQKNATDTAMIIDAMDLLHSGRFDGFCLVSSDSDFTALAQRIREAGLTVYRFGERKTPASFVAACDRFIYAENLTGPPASTGARPPVEQVPAARLKADTALVNLLRGAVEAASDEDGWAHLGGVGSILIKQRPDFDSRTWGYVKLSDLMTATTLFTIDRRSPGDGKPAVLYARDNRHHTSKQPAP